MGQRGNGIKVSVVDTGCGPHGDLNIQDGQNFTADGSSHMFGDVDGHGSHVAGIIGANGLLQGIAPDSEIYSARVFPKDDSALNSDVAEAIRASTED
jgi:subtilisin family serine protease